MSEHFHRTDIDMNRRDLIRYSTGGVLSAALPGLGFAADAPLATIPSTGEKIPTIGLGTWITFNVGNKESIRVQRCEVLNRFFELGGRMVDSSPMYGAAEDVLGFCEERAAGPKDYLRTTKVWTSSNSEGRQQIEQSFDLWSANQFAIYQVHNLVNWEHHLPYLHELKAEGRIRYVGITTSHGRRHREMEELMRSQDLDFVQLTYNLEDREVEDRLLPLAADRGIGVIVNRPFQRGALFRKLNRQPLPDWAADIDCTNMAQIMLKFVISHPAVTCAIPATSQLAHLEEDMAARYGPMPDAALRTEMTKWFDRIY
ncbi:MAG: aldo/keto reductase [Pseudomonadota bacterium]